MSCPSIDPQLIAKISNFDPDVWFNSINPYNKRNLQYVADELSTMPPLTYNWSKRNKRTAGLAIAFRLDKVLDQYWLLSNKTRSRIGTMLDHTCHDIFELTPAMVAIYSKRVRGFGSRVTHAVDYLQFDVQYNPDVLAMCRLSGYDMARLDQFLLIQEDNYPTAAQFSGGIAWREFYMRWFAIRKQSKYVDQWTALLKPKLPPNECGPMYTISYYIPPIDGVSVAPATNTCQV